jgi:hypothetical protein
MGRIKQRGGLHAARNWLHPGVINLLAKWVTCKYTRAVCKVRGPALLLRVGILCRCGDGLFFEVPPLASDALLTTLHRLLENVLQTATSFRRIVEQAILTSWSVRARSSLCMVSLHGLHRLDGWVVGFLIHFFQARHRTKSRNAPLRKYLSCSAGFY